MPKRGHTQKTTSTNLLVRERQVRYSLDILLEFHQHLMGRRVWIVNQIFVSLARRVVHPISTTTPSACETLSLAGNHVQPYVCFVARFFYLTRTLRNRCPC